MATGTSTMASIDAADGPPTIEDGLDVAAGREGAPLAVRGALRADASVCETIGLEPLAAALADAAVQLVPPSLSAADHDRDDQQPPLHIQTILPLHKLVARLRSLAPDDLAAAQSARPIKVPASWAAALARCLPAELAPSSSCTAPNARALCQAADLASLLPQAPHPNQPNGNIHVRLIHPAASLPLERITSGALSYHLLIPSSKPDQDGNHHFGAVTWRVYHRNHRSQVRTALASRGINVDLMTTILDDKTIQDIGIPSYTITQNPGDIVVLPSLAWFQCHAASTTADASWPMLLVSWTRFNVIAADLSISECLPFLQETLAPDHPPVKHMVASAISHWTKQAETLNPDDPNPSMQSFISDFDRLIFMYKHMIQAEWIELQHEAGEHAQPDPFAADLPIFVKPYGFDDDQDATSQNMYRTCSFCHAVIWNRGLECPTVEDNNPYRICFECYSKGRTCVHDVTMKFVQTISMTEMMNTYRQAARAFNRLLTSVSIESVPNRPDLVAEDVSPIDWSAEMVAATTAHRLWARRQSPVTLYCHQCKISRSVHQEILCPACLQQSIRRKGHYCVACLWNRYGLDMYQHLRRRDWACPQCTKTCNCSTCLRDRGVKNFTLEIEPNAAARGRFLLTSWSDDARNKGSYVDTKLLTMMREPAMRGILIPAIVGRNVAGLDGFAAAAAAAAGSLTIGAHDRPSRRTRTTSGLGRLRDSGAEVDKSDPSVSSIISSSGWCDGPVGEASGSGQGRQRARKRRTVSARARLGDLLLVEGVDAQGTMHLSALPSSKTSPRIKNRPGPWSPPLQLKTIHAQNHGADASTSLSSFASPSPTFTSPTLPTHPENSSFMRSTETTFLTAPSSYLQSDPSVAQQQHHAYEQRNMLQSPTLSTTMPSPTMEPVVRRTRHRTVSKSMKFGMPSAWTERADAGDASMPKRHKTITSSGYWCGSDHESMCTLASPCFADLMVSKTSQAITMHHGMTLPPLNGKYPLNIPAAFSFLETVMPASHVRVIEYEMRTHAMFLPKNYKWQYPFPVGFGDKCVRIVGKTESASPRAAMDDGALLPSDSCGVDQALVVVDQDAERQLLRWVYESQRLLSETNLNESLNTLASWLRDREMAIIRGSSLCTSASAQL